MLRITFSSVTGVKAMKSNSAPLEVEELTSKGLPSSTTPTEANN